MSEAGEAVPGNDERYRLALDSAELGTFSIDPSNDTLWSDTRFCAICGVDSGLLSYEQSFALVHPKTGPGCAKPLRLLLRALSSRPFPSSIG